MYLVQECNEREWENPFECSNRQIILSIGISESAISDARNRLKQLGLIDFQAGYRNERPPVYQLFYPFKNGKEAGKQEGKEQGKEAGKHPNILNKQNKNQTETKPNSDTDVSGVSGSESKKSKPKAEKPPRSGAPPPEDVTPHWNRLKSDWIQFYRSKNNDVEPTFKGREAKALQEIASRLQKLTAAAPGTAMHQWTENYAAKVFQHFLMKAWAVEWRRTNFMLHILSSHFDAIIQTDETGNSKAGNKPATGGNVSVTSAFDKIDQMHSATGNTGPDISQS